MIQHMGPISGIAAFSSQLVATAGYDNQLVLWRADTKQSLGRAVHDHLVNQCTFSPSGDLLLSASSDYTARLWHVPTLRLRTVLSDQDDDVEMAVFHPTRPLIATASRDHIVRIYDSIGRLLHRLRGHGADVTSVAWQGTEYEVVSSSDDGTVKRWCGKTGKLLENIDLRGVETDTIAITDIGKIYSGNDQGEIILLGQGEPRIFRAHEAGIKRLAYSSARRILVSLSYDRTLKIWDQKSDGALCLHATASLPPIVWPRSCAFLEPSHLVFGTFGSSYASYDYEQGKWDLSRIEPTQGLNAVLPYGDGILTVGDAGLVKRDGVAQTALGSLCNFLVPLGNIVLTGGQTGQVLDALSGNLLHQHRSPLNCGATFQIAGVHYAIIGSYTGEGLVFRQESSGTAALVAIIPLHHNAIKGVAVSDGVIFSVCADTAAAWHSVEDFRPLIRREHAHDRIANGCAALGGGVFASVSRDLCLRIWRNDERQKISTPHSHSIKCVAVSPSGTLIASGSYDGHVAVYQTTTGRFMAVIRPTMAGISSLAADPRKPGFWASAYDGKVYWIPTEAA